MPDPNLSSPATKRLRVTHVITGLQTGGAEMMLLKLIRQTRENIDHTVISLHGKGTIGPQIEACGVPVLSLKLHGAAQSMVALPKVGKLLNQSRPDVVQGWMYHGNAAATLATFLAGGRWAVSWSIRCTIDTFEEQLRTRLVLRASVILSRAANIIFYNSTPARRQHEAIGYPARGVVLPNGFDVETFLPDPEARAARRSALAIPQGRFAIGYVGRLAVIKDLPTFFSAMARAARSHPDMAVIVVGHDLPKTKAVLPETAADIDFLGDRLVLLPEQSDVTSLYPAFDAFVLSSSAEGFPNVIGEAMSCGVPCISTDVGDCRELIGDTGFVVPPKSPDAMANAVLALVEMEPGARKMLGARARTRTVDKFSIVSIGQSYEAEWRRLAARWTGSV